MPEESRNTLRYRVLRYTPNLVRDEWVNVGVLLEEVDGAAARRAARFIEEDAEITRVRRIHPGADESLLRALGSDFDARLRSPAAAGDLEKLGQTLSNVLQFSPARALLAEDFDAELERLYREHVAPPPSRRGGIIESTRQWIRARVHDVFYRRGILGKLQRGVRVEEFTQPGDTMRIDYAYRYNGTRGYLHPVALNRDPTQAKVLAYTAEQIRRQIKAEFTAITEIEPDANNPRHAFVSRLFEAQAISMVPLNRIERFAEDLRVRLP
ncbi:MAG TPA: DUF3037 domain-containing protein [Candidatus Acidoferrales bacterium]|jgi:hypothetical protein|nr:DUF3037 domain-containing protein [Candidatus Acidoferrales bacterium]